ncbi:MAG: dehydrogenase, partial [Proteiniphilum sp.]
KRAIKNMSLVNDPNEQISYLRSSLIGLLVEECSLVFLENEEDILSGTFHGSLMHQVSRRVREAYENCTRFAVDRIYRSDEVLEIELSGYRIIGHLLEVFTHAILNPEHAYSRLLLDRIPEQYETDARTLYQRVQSILDYISGMTDVYALDLYRKLTGMRLPSG